jgi:hypothetical protein
MKKYTLKFTNYTDESFFDTFNPQIAKTLLGQANQLEFQFKPASTGLFQTW